MIGDKQTGDEANGFGASNSTCVSRSRFDGSFASAHGAVVGNVQVRRVDQSQISRSAHRELERSSMRDRTRWNQRREAAASARILCGRRRLGHDPAAVLMRHRRDATDEVAEIVREIGVVTRRNARIAKVAVVAERQLPRQKYREARRRRTRSCTPERPTIVAGFDLLICWSFIGHEAVADDPLAAAADPALISKAGQIHRVKAGDVLADQVQVGRPPAVEASPDRPEAHGGGVVGKRVEPDVDDALRIPGTGMPHA